MNEMFQWAVLIALVVMGWAQDWINSEETKIFEYLLRRDRNR